MKIIIILVSFICLFVVGCGTSGHPVPSEAFVSCVEKGGSPMYQSNANGTMFDCVYGKTP